MEEYRKRLVEVDEILNHLTINDYSKIPFDIIKTIKENKDSKYKWTFDENKKVEGAIIVAECGIVLADLLKGIIIIIKETFDETKGK